MTTSDAPVRILVIDDIKSQYAMIADFLSATPLSQAYVVDWSPTADATLTAIDTVEYDVFLVDYNLGRQNGLDLLLHIKTLRPDAAYILMTGEGSHALDLEAMRAGAIDYIDKTELKPAALERTIRYAVNQRRALINERQQRRFAEVLLDTVAALNSTLDSDEVLRRILTNIGQVIPNDAANIMLIQAGVTEIIGFHSDTIALSAIDEQSMHFSVVETPSFSHMIETCEPLLVADVQADPAWVPTTYSDRLRAYLGVPIVIGGEVIGFINLDSFHPDFFVATHVQQLQMFAHHAAIAIQNSRAYEKAQELAALEERQRLARDLHDAVSQTLFSANVIAESMPLLWNQDPENALTYLPKLGRLTKGALAEMRALLLELRPAALAETDLQPLLQHLVSAFESRTETEIRLIYESDTTEPLPVEVKIALYRIVQESLNNITKHANARSAEIRFARAGAGAQLTIADDGRGFDPDNIPTDHLGVRMMRERAEKIGANLRIESAVTQGTIIAVGWNSV
ncbi:MAG: GAF domain-containing protein [Chloroflexi bacterium]|nr:GAF domain-containing protein [Chloroflexota bacterium]